MKFSTNANETAKWFDSQQLSSGGRRVVEILITEKVGFQRSKSTNTNFHSKTPIFINQSQYGMT